MSITMIVTIWTLVLMISFNLWTHIPKQRPIPRHSDLYIAMMETFDRPAMVPIECGRNNK
jgi:hypothetical protein